MFGLKCGSGGRGRPRCAAPTARTEPGSLAWQSQAQSWNRSSGNFCKPRAQWHGRNRRKPLRFCAPEIFCLTQGVTPVMGVQGVSRHWRTQFASAASPGDPLGTFPSGKVPRPAGRNPVKLPAARRGRGPGRPLLPLRGNSPSRALRRRQNLRGGGGKPPPYWMRLVKAEQISAPHPPPPWAPDPILSGLRPSPLEKGSRPPGGRPNESGRQNTPLRINDHTNIRFKYFPV